MKQFLILLITVILFGCSTEVKRYHIDELTNKGHKSSQLMYSEDGLFNGIGYDVYDNGELSKEGNYKDGKKDGLWKGWYYYNGQLQYEWNYKDGKQNGLGKFYYPNGSLTEGNYKDGEKNGLWKTYDENGQLEEKGNYKDGYREGVWRNYDEKGKLTSEWEWKNDKILDHKLY